MSDPISRFADDLCDAGLGGRARAVLVLLYVRALMMGTSASWKRLYHALFSALRRLSQEPSAPRLRSFAARATLLRIVEDDLGLAMFGDAAVTRLRTALAFTCSLPVLTRSHAKAPPKESPEVALIGEAAELSHLR